MKIQKALGDTEGEYIVSYISLNHMYHSFLAISKKVGDQYYIVNTIGIMQVNKHSANREGVEPDVRGVFEVIHPNNKKVDVHARHFAVSNNTAKQMLEFMNNKRGRAVNFEQFSKNCHNFAMIGLQDNGIYNSKLSSFRLPAQFKQTCKLTRTEVPASLSTSADKDSYLFSDKDNAHKQRKISEGQDTSKLSAWQWPEGIKIKSKISYEHETAYDKVVANAPQEKNTETNAAMNLKKAIFLLRDYASGSFFWHPLRNYRTLVDTCIKEFEASEENKTVDNLLMRVREAMRKHHKNAGDVGYVKGSLYRRLAYIEFVLNNNDVAVKNRIK